MIAITKHATPAHSWRPSGGIVSTSIGRGTVSASCTYVAHVAKRRRAVYAADRGKVYMDNLLTSNLQPPKCSITASDKNVSTSISMCSLRRASNEHMDIVPIDAVRLTHSGRHLRACKMSECKHDWYLKRICDKNFGVCFATQRTCRKCGKVQVARHDEGRCGGPYRDAVHNETTSTPKV